MARTHWDPALYEAQHSFVWQFGAGLVDVLAPQPGERILDLGCGTGQLTALLAERGADITGIDVSPEMVGQARQNYPRLKFVLGDAAQLSFTGEFDAVFSNAALHWIRGLEEVCRGIARALRPGGRLVLECGAPGNIRLIESALADALQSRGLSLPDQVTFFRSIGAMSTALEAAGLEVTSAYLFDRPTQLTGEEGMAQWLEQFGAHYLNMAPPVQRSALVQQVTSTLRPALYRDGAWFADYRRLRLSAMFACK